MLMRSSHLALALESPDYPTVSIFHYPTISANVIRDQISDSIIHRYKLPEYCSSSLH